MAAIHLLTNEQRRFHSVNARFLPLCIQASSFMPARFLSNNTEAIALLQAAHYLTHTNINHISKI